MAAEEQSPNGPPGSELRPPDAFGQTESAKSGKQGLVWGALVTVVVLGLGVLFVLPGMVSETGSDKTENAGRTVSTADQVIPPADEVSEKSQDDAEKALQDFLHNRARLEHANAPAWGEPEWTRALEGASRGNDLFSQRQFTRAVTALTESLALLQLIESERDVRLENAMDSGWQALDSDASENAVGFFEMAIAIEADNMEALDGLDRARVRPDVLVLMATGHAALSNDDLYGAQAAYQQAVALDGAYTPAENALLDVTQQITELAFRDAMSEALSAIAAEQVKTAEAALRQAESLKPGEEVVKNTRYELAQLQQKLWIADKRKQAAMDERNENWSAAVAIYRNILTRAPQAGFASQGLARAQDRERLHRQFDHYLADPSRIYSDEPRANAEQLVASTGQPGTDELRLADKQKRLQALIDEAKTPLKVTLLSDGQTEVAIYHVGRLGQFTSQQLELRPGTYTVVGSRPGYRDVRQTFTIKPGSAPPELVIRCEEPV